MSVWNSERTLIVGHRGGRGPDWPPENTLEAFERARAFGADAVELDVRTTATGEVVVFHDVDLGRMTGGATSASVATLSLAHLRDIPLVDGKARVPLLSEVLTWASDCGVGVNVEIKHDVPSRARLTYATMSAIRASGADVLVSSFDPAVLALAAPLAPSVPRAILTHGREGLAGHLLHAVARRPLCNAVHLEAVTLVASTLRRLRRRHLKVGVWTLNDSVRACALRDARVNWIITDRADVIAGAFRSGAT